MDKRLDLAAFLSLGRNTSTAEAHALIDTKLSEILKSISALNSQRNAHASISKLPKDVLARIFSLCQSWPGHDYVIHDYMRWIQVTHVSRTWREIALASPFLWSDISFHLPHSWVKEMIFRSRPALIAVRVFLSSAELDLQQSLRYQILQDLLREDLNRIHTININGPSTQRHLETLFRDVAAQSAPHLRSLFIESRRDQNFEDEDLLHFCEKILIDTPNLNRLDVPYTLSWNSRLLTNLVYLKVHNATSKNRPLCSEFLNAFRRLDSLETLHLLNSIPCRSGEQPFPILILPRLRTVDIKDKIPNVAFFLDQIHFPPSTSVSLLVQGPCPADKDYTKILPFLTRFYSPPTAHFQSVPVPVIRRLIITSAGQNNSTGSITLQTWSTLPEALDKYIPTTTLSAPDLKIEFQWQNSRTDQVQRPATDQGLRAEFRQICSHLPLQNLGFLRLNGTLELHKDEWLALESETFLETFGNLPTLRTIHVGGSAVAPLIMALGTRPPDTHVVDEQITRHFPGLRYLWLDQPDFSYDGWGADNGVNITRDVLGKASLEVLGIRRANYLSEKGVGKFRKVVPEVNWDGYMSGFEMDTEEVSPYCPECGRYNMEE